MEVSRGANDLLPRKQERNGKWNLLVVYYSHSLLRKATARDHLFCFQKYSGCNCFYLNLALRKVPWYLKHIPFDLVVFSTIFLGARWNKTHSLRALKRARALKQVSGIRMILPQDEFVNTQWLTDFINEFQIQYIFSVAPETEWPLIYSGVDLQQVRFFRVLTGYLDEGTLVRISGLSRTVQDRSIDIGYRSVALPWWGRFGWLRQQLAEVFKSNAPRRGLRVDISTRPEDFLTADQWYAFLLSCKYTLGVEGGASILDRDGTIQECCLDYLARRKEASFEELEAACFPRMDGSLQLRAISPRHLEACATRTCQVLIEGEYNGILKPNRHYIELRRDFSNADQILDIIQRDELRSDIVDRAYREVVESERFTYSRFVEYVLERVFKDSPRRQSTLWSRALIAVGGSMMRFEEALMWCAAAVVTWAQNNLPKWLVARMREYLLRIA